MRFYFCSMWDERPDELTSFTMQHEKYQIIASCIERVTHVGQYGAGKVPFTWYL